MKRRSLLRRTGLLLGAWGVSELGLSLGVPMVSRTASALAQPTTRKLALLIGINAYRNEPLNGCLTDIELQRELLTYRFGFQPGDILTLANEKATRSQIETAFTEHLIRQAKPDDVVVIHFSGYGSLLKLGTADEIQPALITADLPSEELLTNAIPEDTLYLLLRSLQTDQVTTVLDTSYVYPGSALQGNLRIRSRPADGVASLDQTEQLLQQDLLNTLALDRAQVRTQRLSGQMPGIILAAAGDQQVATEAPWNGFHAGLFTYALTQQLWQALPHSTLRVNLSRTAERLGKRVDQKQQITISGKNRGSSGGILSAPHFSMPYNLSPSQPPADGVITATDDPKTVHLWLGGLAPQVFEQYSLNSLFTVESDSVASASDAQPLPLLQVYERNGLTAKAKVVATSSTQDAVLAVGQRVQEAIRVLPRTVGLAIAIDSHLKRIERVDAVSAFSAVSYVSAATAGEQAVDYVFGRGRATTQVASLSTDAIVGSIPPSSYGLFSQGRDVIPKTLGDSDEAVKLAVRRLAPQLQTLLGAKMLGLTVNDSSSQLGVRATLAQLGSPEKLLVQQQTDRVASDPNLITPSDGKLITIPIGNRIQYRIENTSTQPIYVLVLGLDNSGTAIGVWHNSEAALQPSSPSTIPDQPYWVAPGESAFIPVSAPNSEWVIRDPVGLAETYIICSRAPFQQTESLLNSNLSSRVLRPIDNFLEVAQAVVQDLHQASDRASQWIGTSDVFTLDVNAWATFRFIHQVTA
ncbi:caspase family protein [Myxacorys almedinensis]|uniref:Peptidase C14 n=1 Tax=Myxacorys almedinensis A TaxID=2690445 RepID=A0A8J7YZH4_9CYAN|nr:caspase family protein [Myxacorys almedinensis]NDJ17392.1 peptidase C14 [Myxacorys almedinensis A]